jgi:SAM-dependent methyltransferase
MRAAFHLASLRRDDITRAAIVVDSETEIRADAVTALLRPWSAWLEIIDIVATDMTSPDKWQPWLDTAASSGAQAVSIISDRSEFADQIKSAATRYGLRVVSSDYPTDTDRTVALFHEMSHHHYELGGLNEWNKTSSIHGSSVLQHMSTTNCIKHFPEYVIDELWAQYTTAGRSLEALDIGCGPISRLRWGALQGLLHITGVDPLLDLYEIILRHHGLDPLPSIRVERALTTNAENLEHHIAADSIDFAFCCNALDHVEDPPVIVAQVARALRPGASFALEFATREGSRQDWQQLHQFDLFLDSNNNELMCQWHNGDLGALVLPHIPLDLTRVIMATDDYTAVVLRKRELI